MFKTVLSQRSDQSLFVSRSDQTSAAPAMPVNLFLRLRILYCTTVLLYYCTTVQQWYCITVVKVFKGFIDENGTFGSGEVEKSKQSTTECCFDTLFGCNTISRHVPRHALELFSWKQVDWGTWLGSRYHCLSRVVALKDLNRPSLNEVQGSEGFSGRFFLEGDCRAQLTSPFTISSCQALDPPPLPQCYCSHHRQHGLPDFHISHFILIQGVVHDVLSVPLQCSALPSLLW